MMTKRSVPPEPRRGRGRHVPGLFKRGRVYWVKYYQNGRAVRESTGTDKETEAKRFLEGRKGRVATGQPILPRADRVLCGELLDDLRVEPDAGDEERERGAVDARDVEPARAAAEHRARDALGITREAEVGAHHVRGAQRQDRDRDRGLDEAVEHLAHRPVAADRHDDVVGAVLRAHRRAAVAAAGGQEELAFRPRRREAPRPSVVGTIISRTPPGLSTRYASFSVCILSGKCSNMSCALISSIELSSHGHRSRRSAI